MIRIAALALLLTGCATVDTMNYIMGSWEGENVAEVTRAWGYPNEERTFQGRKIYVWTDSQITSMPGLTTNTTRTSVAVAAGPGQINANVKQNSVGSIIGGGPQSYTCIRTLEVDDKEIVRGWGSQGNGCCFAAIGGQCAAWINPKKRPPG